MANRYLDIINEDTPSVRKKTDLGQERWTATELFGFRVFGTYLLLLCLPLTPDWYKYISNLNFAELNCRDLFIISTYRDLHLVNVHTESWRWGFASYFNLFLLFGISVLVAVVWSILDSKRRNYNILKYWVTVIARYRVGIGIVAWGFRKLVPGQMVLPTLGVLNTPYGDFQAQKLYWQGVGIVPGYEVFLGLAEFVAGFLLLFRKTTAVGAALTAVVLGNIVLANHVYDGGVHIHSATYTIIAIILFADYVPSLWRVFVQKQDASLSIYDPQNEAKWIIYLRRSLKVFTHSVFVVLFFGLQIHDYITEPYRIPDTPGIAGIQGYYEVEQFTNNGQVIPYSPHEAKRWHDAIFEKWSTLSFKVNRGVDIDQSNGGGAPKKDVERSWEVAGIANGRRFYYYKDTLNHRLKLQNKNEKDRAERLELQLKQLDENKIQLSGLGLDKDSISVILVKESKKYPLIDATLGQIEIFKPNYKSYINY